MPGRSDLDAQDRIGRPGHNCERVAPAGRAALLVDGERYFEAVRHALVRAERSILIVGWDIHSDVRLTRGPDATGETLGELVVSLVRRRRRLRAHVLVWDFAMLYAAERQLMPLFSRWWRLPHGLTFRYDDQHPLGASHHQKIVVVDDSVAFVGGLDLTARRWDTRAHRAEEPCRVDPWGGAYGPFHDVQMVVDGAAAAAIGALVRARWANVTWRPPRRVARRWRGDRWPAGVEPDMRDVEVAIARTLPAWGERPAVREVERLYLDAIAAARRVIYIENQYLTSRVIADALASRLREPAGPEVVIIGPAVCSGWLEEQTMGALRGQLLRGMAEADRFGRLRVYAPHAADDPSVAVTVHSKVMIVDDRYVHVGSANLDNRSMGLDSECDLGIEATRPDLAVAIERLRDDVVAEHLHVSPDEVRRAVTHVGGLGAAIESLRAEAPSLQPIDPAASAPDDLGVLPAVLPVDPERPIAPEAFVGWLWPSGEGSDRPRRRWPLLAAAICAVAAVVAWERVTPSVTVAAIVDRATFAAQTTWGAPVGAVGLALASTIMIPLVPLIVASGIVFGPWTGFGVALVGGTLGAALGHALGGWLWRDAIRRVLGRRANRLAATLRRGGLAAVIFVRLVPVAPFAMVNLAAGATRIRRRDMVIGTAVGLAPGTLALTFASDRGQALLRNPNATTIGGLVVAMALLVAIVVGSRRLLGRRDP